MKLCSVWLELLLSCSHMNNSSTPSTKWNLLWIIQSLTYINLHTKNESRLMKITCSFGRNFRFQQLKTMKEEWNFHKISHRIIVNLIFMIHAFYLARERKKVSRKALESIDKTYKSSFWIFCFVIICEMAQKKTNVFSYRKVRCHKGQRRPQEITSSSFSSWNSQKDARKKRLEKRSMVRWITNHVRTKELLIRK